MPRQSAKPSYLTRTKLRMRKCSRAKSHISRAVNYTMDAAGNLTSDGLRAFDYDATNRHSQTTVSKDGEASKITYLHNALGQRVFKSEPQTAQTLPNEAELGTSFTDWLKKNFNWLYATAQTNATLGDSYVYADGGASGLPTYAMLGEYGNGGASSAGRTEYLYLPTDNGQAIPVGLFRGARFYAVHADHLNTPRLINDDSNKAVWQWPYSAFGDNKPVGILKATTNPANAYTQDPTTNVRLQATNAAITYNPRFSGQYSDSESGMFYNTQRSYLAGQGRYSQGDPIGLGGGWSRFGYVEGNTLSRIDPEGLDWLEDAADFSAGFGDTLSFGLTQHIRSSWGIGGVNYCSSAHTAGVATELLGEVLLTGGSMALGRMATKVGSRSAQASARTGKDAFRKENGLQGGQIHHNNPLVGHPGGGGALFPTGGLPASVHSGAWNLTYAATRSEHMALHQSLKRLEALGRALVNTVATLARVALASQCGCN